MGKIREKIWDCQYCGTTRIGGSKSSCPNCGRKRDKNTFFYSNPYANCLTTDEAKKINRNPDWLCPFCDSLNSDSNTECSSCGHPREASDLNYFENRKTKLKEEAKKTLQINDSEFQSLPTEGDTKISFFSMLSFKTIGILSSILVSILVLLLIFLPREQEVTIIQKSWERSINIEKYKTVQENDWLLPEKAKLLYTTSEVYDYDRVIDHYEKKTRPVHHKDLVGYEDIKNWKDLGNGYEEEVVVGQKPIYKEYDTEEEYDSPVYRYDPIYKTMYYYEIDKWVYERSITTHENNSNPYWGKLILEENEREKSRSEKYNVTAINKKGKKITFSLSAEDWESVKNEETIKVSVSLGHGKIVK